MINPGRKKLWRIYNKEGKAEADVVGLKDEELKKKKELKLFHPVEPSVCRTLKREEISEIEPLLKKWPGKESGLSQKKIIENCRRARKKDLTRLHTGVKRLINPHIYHVSLTEKLKNLKEELKEKHGEEN
jgi:nicotinate phosphoribosyltransferase